jgi:uncharacterized protein (DUF58 family)
MLTKSGLSAVLVAVILGAFGWWWGYEELVVAGVGLLGLVVTAIWISQRPTRAVVRRQLSSVRIPRGDPIGLVYRVSNATKFGSTEATIIDRCDDIEARVELPAVPPNTERSVLGTIPTRRRGVFDVGPLDIERIDPFWLSIGRRRDDRLAQVIVHPKIYDLVGPHGAVRVVENESVLRRATSDPMSGFVAMREYVAGDDPRMIHWPTTARTGTLMVREHVEVRRPEFTIVLDTADTVGTPEDFEEAVDVTATLAVHAIRTGIEVVVRTTNREHTGRATPLANDAAVLDLLTPVQQCDGVVLVPVGSLFTGGLDHTSVLMVTGPTGPSSRFATSERLSIVRIGVGAAAERGVVLAANDAKEFVRRWRSWA